MVCSRRNGDNVVAVDLEPGRTTKYGVCIDSVRRGDEIEHGRMPQFIPIAAKHAAGYFRSGIYLPLFDANVGGIEL